MLTHGTGNRVTAVGVETGYGQEGRGVGIRVPVRARVLFSPLFSDRFWGPPSPWD
jgi:hypothetical protein